MFSFISQFNEKTSSYLQGLNKSKYLAGVLMIVSNLFAKYVSIKFTKTQEAYIKNLLGRQLIIFTIIFIATHDIIVSLVLTIVFIISVDYLLNEESKFCIIPKYIQMKIRDMEESLLLDDDDEYPSDEDIERAQKILDKSKSHDVKKHKEKQKFMFNMMYSQLPA